MTQPPGGPNPTSVDALPGPFSLSGVVRAPRPDTIADRNFGILTEVYDDSALLVVPVRVARDAPLEPMLLQLTISYQSCAERICLPLRTDTVTADLTIVERSHDANGLDADTTTEIAAPRPIDGGSTEFTGVQAERAPGPALGAFLWLAVSMGALALLTP
jgi:DsbC/DsbD-like thiol-disulfide interchange protein